MKDAIAKNFVANEHHSFTFVFTFSVVVVDLPTDCILSFLFPAETDVLVPVFSQSTDVVVVNFVVVLRFPINHFSWLRKIFWLEVNRLWHGYRLTTRLRALLNNSTANLKFYWSNTLWYSQIKWQLACKANVSVWFRSKQRGTRPLPNPTLFWMYF